MKKLLLVLALSFAAALCASAQDLSVLGKAARLAYDYLSKEGYKPYIDEDDDYDEDKLTEESYRTTIDEDPEELSLEAAEVADDDEY